MIQIYKPQNQQLGLKGFFSWLKKAVTAVINVATNIAIPGNGYNVLTAIMDFVDGDGTFGGVGFRTTSGSVFYRLNNDYPVKIDFIDLPLSDSDVLKLDNWLYNTFLPFYTDILNSLKQLDLSKKTNFNLISERYNYVQELVSYIDYMMPYSEANGQQNLSLNAVKTKNAFLEIKKSYLIEQLENLIEKYQYNYNTQPVVISSNKFSPIGYDYIEPITINVRVLSNKTITNSGVPIVKPNEEKDNNKFLSVIGKIVLITGSALLISSIASENKDNSKAD